MKIEEVKKFARKLHNEGLEYHNLNITKEDQYIVTGLEDFIAHQLFEILEMKLEEQIKSD